MAKKKSPNGAKATAPSDVLAAGGPSQPTTTPVTALAETHTPGASAPAGTAAVRRGAPATSAPDVATQLAEVVSGLSAVTRAVLPSRLPTYLGAAALVVAGVIDPPVALAGGLAYEALRRWTPAQRG